MNVNLSSVTTPLRAIWDELVERRLWPFAIVLVVAIIAVPVVLSKSTGQPPPPPSPSAAASASSPTVAFQPAVSTEGKKSSEIRKNLRRFTRKNPFTPQGLSAGGSAATAAGTAQAPTSGTTSSNLGGTVGSTSSGTSSSPSTAPSSPNSTSGTVPTLPSKTFYYSYTVDVRFGKTGNEDAKTLTEFRALPGTDNPVVVFLGVRADGKTSVFLVSASATTTGDGKCKPSDTECTFLYMKKGDSQTIEAVDTGGAITDYTLKVKAVHVKRSDVPAKAGASRHAHASKTKRHAKRFRSVVHSFRTLGL